MKVEQAYVSLKKEETYKVSVILGEEFEDRPTLHCEEKDSFLDVDSYLAPSDSPYAEAIDNHIGMNVDLPHQGERREERVVSRKRNNDGMLVGTANENSTLDSRVYIVDFGDGDYAEYSANVLMENLYSQVDKQGKQFSMLKWNS